MQEHVIGQHMLRMWICRAQFVSGPQIGQAYRDGFMVEEPPSTNSTNRDGNSIVASSINEWWDSVQKKVRKSWKKWLSVMKSQGKITKNRLFLTFFFTEDEMQADWHSSDTGCKNYLHHCMERTPFHCQKHCHCSQFTFAFFSRYLLLRSLWHKLLEAGIPSVHHVSSTWYLPFAVEIFLQHSWKYHWTKYQQLPSYWEHEHVWEIPHMSPLFGWAISSTDNVLVKTCKEKQAKKEVMIGVNGTCQFHMSAIQTYYLEEQVIQDTMSEWGVTKHSLISHTIMMMYSSHNMIKPYQHKTHMTYTNCTSTSQSHSTYSMTRGTIFAEGERNDMQSTITRRTEWLNAATTPMKETNSLHMGKHVRGFHWNLVKNPSKLWCLNKCTTETHCYTGACS